MLKIVVLSLQAESGQSLPGKILTFAHKELRKMNCSISKKDIQCLYNKMSDQNRDNLRFDQTLFLLKNRKIPTF